ncbi:MAG: hypothetical protein AAF998_13330 [Bacteroidota bacterium]
MATQDNGRTNLEDLFSDGSRPTGDDFTLLIESFVNRYNGSLNDEIGELKVDDDTLSNRLQTNDSQLTNLETTTGDHTTRITDLEDYVGTKSGSITSLTTATEDHTTRITDLEDYVGTRSGNITSLTVTTEDHIQRIAALEGDVGSNANDIAANELTLVRVDSILTENSTALQIKPLTYSGDQHIELLPGGNGNLGIGTTTPTELVDIRRESATLRLNGRADASQGVRATIETYGARDNDDEEFAELLFYNYDDNASSKQDYPGTRIQGVRSGANGAELRFATAKSGTLTDHLTIDPDGQVGIGTTDPDSVLHIEHANAILRVDGRKGEESGRWGILETFGARDSGNNAFGELRFYNYDRGVAAPEDKLSARITAAHSDTDGSRLQFATMKEGTLQDHLIIENNGDILVHGSKPIFFIRYEGIGDNLNFDTEVLVSDYNAGIVGYVTESVNISESNTDMTFIRLRMLENNGTWRIRADLHSESGNPENWYVDVLFISTAISDYTVYQST